MIQPNRGSPEAPQIPCLFLTNSQYSATVYAILKIRARSGNPAARPVVAATLIARKTARSRRRSDGVAALSRPHRAATARGAGCAPAADDREPGRYPRGDGGGRRCRRDRGHHLGAKRHAGAHAEDRAGRDLNQEAELLTDSVRRGRGAARCSATTATGGQCARSKIHDAASSTFGRFRVRASTSIRIGRFSPPL